MPDLSRHENTFASTSPETFNSFHDNSWKLQDRQLVATNNEVPRIRDRDLRADSPGRRVGYFIISSERRSEFRMPEKVDLVALWTSHSDSKTAENRSRNFVGLLSNGSFSNGNISDVGMHKQTYLFLLPDSYFCAFTDSHLYSDFFLRAMIQWSPKDGKKKTIIERWNHPSKTARKGKSHRLPDNLLFLSQCCLKMLT